jgi:hypothetical protein
MDRLPLCWNERRQVQRLASRCAHFIFRWFWRYCTIISGFGVLHSGDNAINRYNWAGGHCVKLSQMTRRFDQRTIAVPRSRKISTQKRRHCTGRSAKYNVCWPCAGCIVGSSTIRNTTAIYPFQGNPGWNLETTHRLNRDPISHRMRKDVDLICVARQEKTERVF